MQEKIANTCCFTGHRTIPIRDMEIMIESLYEHVERLAESGVTHFLSGGAIGFDLFCASVVIALREKGYQIQLIMALPCKNQDEKWSMKQKKLYQDILLKANEIHYVSEHYTDGCMKKRNHYMIDHSAVCIAYLRNQRSGTGQTVRYGEKKGIRMIRL